MRLRTQPKRIEYLFGISMTLIVMIIVLFYNLGFAELNLINTPFFVFIFSISPLFGNPQNAVGSIDHLLHILTLIGFAVSFFLLIRFVKTPYLRFGVATHFGLWVLYGLNFAALNY